MILRIFRAIVHDGRQSDFEKFIRGKALPLTRAQQGLLFVTVGLPRSESPNEFSMVTAWRDLEALKGFTGESWRQAVVLPEETHMLRDSYLHHYEVAES